MVGLNVVDDPACVNGPNTTDATYAGPLGAYHSASSACHGINLRSINVIFALLSIFANLTCLYFAYRMLLSRRKTRYNIFMTLCPIAGAMGSTVDLFSASTYFHCSGIPDLSQLTKIFFYTGTFFMIWVQEFRFDFILVVTGKNRRIARRMVWVNVGIWCVLGIFTIAMWVQGRWNQPKLVSYAIPYAFWLFYITLLDCTLSVILLNLSLRQTSLLRSYDLLTIAQVKSFSTRFRRAALLHLFIIVIATALFMLAGSTEVGYSIGMITTPTIPAQLAVTIYSIHTLQNMERLRSAPKVQNSQSKSKDKSDLAIGKPMSSAKGLIVPSGVGRVSTCVESQAVPSNNVVSRV
ncbi:hypothetical protein SpCBS45565_g05325 [Spizellomyces sp. 'palustris']|nr:hypothetical protein SpCBS45565_g05325 [Spizellomyces sp. 'palustris']